MPIRTHELGAHVHLWAAAQLGQLPVGWSQLIAGLDWEFKKDYIAKLGYRVLDWDYEEDGVVWDMAMNGMYLGLGIRF